MEGDPFSLVEAMTIAAYATGCEQGFIYVRGEYPLATERLQHAIDAARARGLLGDERDGPRVRVRHRDPAGRRRVHLRRRDRDLQLDRGLPRRAPEQAAVPGPVRRLRQAHGHQQRRDPGQRARDPPDRRAGVRQDRHRGSRRGRGCSACPDASSGRACTRCRSAPRCGRCSSMAGGRRRRAAPCRRSCWAARPACSSAPDEIDMPLTFEGARAAQATLGSGVIMVFDDTIDTEADPAPDRGLLPGRVLRAVRAVPGRAPCGRKRRCTGIQVAKPQGRRAGRARAARGDRPGHEGRVHLRPGADRLQRGGVRDQAAAPVRRSGADDRELHPAGPAAAAAAHRRAQDRRRAGPGARRHARCSRPAGRRGRRSRPSATWRPCTRSTSAACAWSRWRGRGCWCRRARGRSSPAWWCKTDSERVQHSRKMVLEFLASSVDLSTTPDVARWLTEYGCRPERYGPPAPPSPAGVRDSPQPGHHDAAASRRTRPPSPSRSRWTTSCTCGTTASASCATSASRPAARTTRTPSRSPSRGAGFDARISTEFAVELPESACVYCGNCIAVCPTGRADVQERARPPAARAPGTSRARPSPPTICPYCGVGCNLELHVQDNEIVKVTSPLDHEVTRGNSASRAGSAGDTCRTGGRRDAAGGGRRRP